MNTIGLAPSPTAIVLIPGFFGYGTFGDDEKAPLLEYFAGVREQLVNAGLTEDNGYSIVAHEPPPTGSLDERVASLHDLVGKLLAGEPLRHEQKPIKANRIQLVGHSTGGVDARLFANPRYTWKGGPRCDEERRSRIDKVGAVVTLSAPLYGTPIASHIKGDANLLLQGIQAFTMLGVFKNGALDTEAIKVVKELLKGLPAILHKGLPAGIAALAKRVDPAVRNSPPDLLIGVPAITETIAEQIGKFFQSIEDDRQLLGDLTVAHLEPLARTLAGGDVRPISSYVTLSPPPSFELKALVTDPIAEEVYRIVFGATAHDPLARPIPQANLVIAGSSRAVVDEVLKSNVACDGVVPARSQTIGGEAAGVVFGDHLDVVGSFPGGKGVNVMHSGAGFGAAQFEALWKDVAKRLI